MEENRKRLKARLDRAEKYLQALENEEVDAVVGKQHVMLLRLREMEERLRLSEARYRSIVEGQTELICRWLPDRTLSFANEAYCRFYGLNREESLGQILDPVADPRDRERVRRYFDSLGPDNPSSEIEYRVAIDHQVRWVHWSDRAIFDAEGRLIEFQSVGRDITERKKLEASLRQSRAELQRRYDHKTAQLHHTHETLQTIIDEIPVMLCFYDDSGRALSVNRALERITGWTIEDARRPDFLEKCYPDPEYRREVWDYMKSAVCEWRDIRMRCRDGSNLDSAWSNIRLSDGTQVGLGIDVSERKKAENVLREMSHRTLEALERDRQAVAKELHDSIGGSLAAIKFALEGRVSVMQENPHPEEMSLEKILAHLAETIKESKRISARLRPPTLDELGLLATLRNYLREFCEFFPGIRFEHRIELTEADVPEPFKLALYRVVQESLNNISKHSCAKSVRLTLEKKTDCIVLEMTDDGIGFNPSNVQNQPLGGYGLGSMEERIRICGGTFRVDSEPDKGTVVCATLPLKADSAPKIL